MPEEKPNLADFDRIGIDPAKRQLTVPASPQPSAPEPPKKTPPKVPTPTRVKRTVFGCLGFLFFAFAILLVAMAVGLSAGNDMIKSLGFDPTVFKSWSLGLVNIFFGTISLFTVVIALLAAAKAILATSEQAKSRKSSIRTSLASLFFLAVFVTVWVLVYNYFSRFAVEVEEVPIEIVTVPRDTTLLTSPIAIDFSAERMTTSFHKTYDILDYEWDKEGDGFIDDTGEKVSLYFENRGPNEGLYNVKLILKLRPKGGTEVIAKEYETLVTIVKQELYGDILVDFESGEVPLTVKFNGSQIRDPDGDTIRNYAWDLDADGRPDYDGPTYSKVQKTFETIGDHEVTLTVTSSDRTDDGEYEVKTFTKTISVKEPTENQNASAVITATPQSGIAPLTVQLDASESFSDDETQIDSYEWLIGDGLTKLTGMRNKFTFEKPGTYPVTLRATYQNGQIKTDTVEIVAVDSEFAPTAKISTDPAYNSRTKSVSGKAPLTVLFDGTVSTDRDENIVNYEWDFDADDLIDDEGERVGYTFVNPGEYRVILRVTDSDGASDTAELKILVDSEDATVDFGASTQAGPYPLTVDFDASGSVLPDRQIISYEWDFDLDERGGSYITEQAQTSHIFESVGQYRVGLTLHGNDGSTERDELTIVVTNQVLQANISASRLSGDAPLAITFEAEGSTGQIRNLEWDFGDGAVSAESRVVHIFAEAGQYEVTLRVYDYDGNVSTATKTVTVN